MRLSASTLASLTMGLLFLFGGTLYAEEGTAKLDLKRLSPTTLEEIPKDYLLRGLSSQSIMTTFGKSKIAISLGDEKKHALAFQRLVKKEPAYKSEYPIKGVIRFGDKEIPIAADAVPEEKKDNAGKKPDEKKAVQEKPNGGQTAPVAVDSATAVPVQGAYVIQGGAIAIAVGAVPEDKKNDARKITDETATFEQERTGRIAAPIAVSGGIAVSYPVNAGEIKGDAVKKEMKILPPAPLYNRLYIDLNGNGDLTDDPVVLCEPSSQSTQNPGVSISSFSFPRIDIMIDIEGKKTEYSFYARGISTIQEDFSFVELGFSPAVYREGEITLGGKKRHIYLVDFNANGRFDDVYANRKEKVEGNEVIIPEMGDYLLIDPDLDSPMTSGDPFDVTTSKDRLLVSKLIGVDGVYYDVKISPAGDSLSMTESNAPLGKVTNPNAHFAAMVYNDEGNVLVVRGEKDKPIAIPAGQWRLLGYTIDLTDLPNAKTEQSERKPAAGGAVVVNPNALGGLAVGAGMANAPRSTLVKSQTRGTAQPIKVVAGETTVFPFGPPYKAEVALQVITPPNAKENVATIALSFLGTAGEQITSLIVDGGIPMKPAFTITDPDGKEVQSGSFEYG